MKTKKLFFTNPKVNEAYIFCFFEFTLLARESKQVETKVAMVTQWFIE
ncbi:protein of unknown function [Shewanella benthica]|uniref:Uncharacterized protein n=2 Tax=Shewanella benthica TaxID=43661 RepID=A0A330LWE0_9GAMM|nr:protein of unknown function [Shewanella benthica]SQH74499.1 protein of unknown function [Shewanella benthica]